MSAKTPVNIPASIRQRLLNLAKHEKRPFNEMLQYYAMERFLYRLSRSIHAERFILKGALMLRVWCALDSRPTMDIDLLGRANNDAVAIVEQIKDILSVKVKPDGVIFEQDSVQAERIAKDAEYEGVRIRFRGTLDSARINMQVDIGFGDVVFPEPEKTELPVMLNFPSPRLLSYSRESTIAEKFEAMVKLRELNSRMKDFYDIWLLSRQFDFDGRTLAEAIQKTFDHRGTELPTDPPVAFSSGFSGDQNKNRQWQAFLKRNRLEGPGKLAQVAEALQKFIMPLVNALNEGNEFKMIWKPGAGWD